MAQTPEEREAAKERARQLAEEREAAAQLAEDDKRRAEQAKADQARIDEANRIRNERLAEQRKKNQ